MACFVSCTGLPSRSTAVAATCSPWLSSSRFETSRQTRLRTIASNSHVTVASAQVSDTVSPVVPILMGSASDTKHCEKISNALKSFGIEAELRIASAHKVPHRLLDVLAAYESDPRPKVYIAVAGRSNALSGVLDCAVTGPVISCPPYSDSFAGADLFSSIRMPGGVAPSLVLDPAGAALCAAKILGVSCPDVRAKVKALQEANQKRLIADDAAIVARSYLPRIAKARENNLPLDSTDTSIVFGSAANGPAIGAKNEGKVRDRYEFRGVNGERYVALVTTDRQSAFDRVLATVPFKGAVLNLVSAWWFDQTKHILPNHVVAVPHSNVTIAMQCKPFPVEFVVRAYITGSTKTSLWRNYSSGAREYCGISFPDGLQKNQRLATPVLTPTTKSDTGDRPIAPIDVVREGLMSQSDWDACAKAAMALFAHGQETAAQNGLILVDTKYEFGIDDDGVIRLIDEIHTPDSSRYWIAASYEPRFAKGDEPENVDKEFLRLWFADNAKPYDKSVPLPDAPPDLVDQLSMKYVMLYELITGTSFDFLAAEHGANEISAALSSYVGAGEQVGAK